ncbi:hypothetical protein [Frisingicoccus sp.]|uniref:hypothetical protein n=1 Tax=Frisingicoccus sp. TaxID=1918627 RepID=UPI003AB88179
MAAGLTGVKLTTQEVRNITGNIKGISSDVDDTMGEFQEIMTKLTGQSEGGLIDQTVTAAQQLFNGITDLAKCFLNLGLKIGDYLNAVLQNDSDMAQNLRDQIER